MGPVILSNFETKSLLYNVRSDTRIVITALNLIREENGSLEEGNSMFTCASSLDINARMFDVWCQESRLINLETRGWSRGEKAREASRRIEVPHESESRSSRSEIAAGGCTCSVCSVCGPPIHHVAGLFSSQRSDVKYDRAGKWSLKLVRHCGGSVTSHLHREISRHAAPHDI